MFEGAEQGDLLFDQRRKFLIPSREGRGRRGKLSDKLGNTTNSRHRLRNCASRKH